MNGRDRQHGQTIVIVALALIPLLLVVGLVVDGGWAFAQQRQTQNAMDAAANAGAVVMVQNLPFTTRGEPAPRTDADVETQVLAVAAVNGVADPAPTAVYTDIAGERLDPEVVVGSLGNVPPPADAFGVEVEGSTPFGTFFAGLAGMTGFKASAHATAVVGAINSICAADEPCAFIPVTFPTEFTNCDGTGKQALFGTTYPMTTNPTYDNETIIPLCGTSNGSVGWLDIEPGHPDCNGGGAQELACNIENPSRTSLPLPIWIDTVTGNVNSSQVQDALDDFTGDVVGTYEPGLDLTVQIPLYECIDNDIPQGGPLPLCPSPEVTGIGSHTSYRIVALAAMILDQAYVTGGNAACKSDPGSPYMTGNGLNSCLKGWITQIVYSGQVEEPTGDVPGTVWGVQRFASGQDLAAVHSGGLRPSAFRCPGAPRGGTHACPLTGRTGYAPAHRFKPRCKPGHGVFASCPNRNVDCHAQAPQPNPAAPGP